MMAYHPIQGGVEVLLVIWRVYIRLLNKLSVALSLADGPSASENQKLLVWQDQ